MLNMNPALEELRWKKIPLLNDGFVCLVDAMGEDSSVVQAAKISYGKDVREPEVILCDNCRGSGYVDPDIPPPISILCRVCNGSGRICNPDWTGQPDKDRTLLRYLMRNRHTTPFEMCELKFLIRIPMDAWRQMIRHRTASVNEYSTRYTEAINSQQTTLPGEWRLQSGSNKQGSSGLLEEWPDGWHTEPNMDGDPETGLPDSCNVIYESKDGGLKIHEHQAGPWNLTPGEYLSEKEEDFQAHANNVYNRRLALGIAREQARKDLPLSTYTEAYWKIDLHNLFHFLGLRMDSHAQLEIRLYANAIGSIAEQLFPMCWEAFKDYRLDAMSLSRLDILAAQELKAVPSICLDADTVDVCLTIAGFTNKREKDECIAKMKRLRIL